VKLDAHEYWKVRRRKKLVMLSAVAVRHTIVRLVRKTRIGNSGQAACRSLRTRRASETAPTLTGA